jgi:hypothetical protein
MRWQNAAATPLCPLREIFREFESAVAAALWRRTTKKARRFCRRALIEKSPAYFFAAS